jgi:hypothetical protein
MMRQADSGIRVLLRLQGERVKAETAMRPAAMERAGYWFRSVSVPATEPIVAEPTVSEPVVPKPPPPEPPEPEPPAAQASTPQPARPTHSSGPDWNTAP